MPNVTVDEVVKALYLDLVESYPDLTLEWLKEEAEKQIAGRLPAGGPGMLLNRYLQKTGFIS